MLIAGGLLSKSDQHVRCASSSGCALLGFCDVTKMLVQQQATRLHGQMLNSTADDYNKYYHQKRAVGGIWSYLGR